MTMSPLIDSYQRPVTYLRVSITDRCNLRCLYCMPEEGLQWLEAGNILTYNEIIRLVEVASRRGLRKVRITGGEPLVRPGVASLIEGLRAIEALSDVTLTTNGVFLKEQVAGLYRAGLRRINISLDSLNPATFAKIVRRDIFSRVWEGIEAAEQIGFDPIKINVVLQAGVNDHETDDFVRLTLKRPYHIRFIEYMPCANWDRWVATYRPFGPVKEVIEQEWGPLIPLGLPNEGDAGPAENFRVPGASGVIGFIHAVSHDFCGTCNRIRLTADGKMRPCLYSETAVDFKAALRGGCDDATLNRLLDHVMKVKPKYHELDLRPKEKQLLTMVNIGG